MTSHDEGGEAPCLAHLLDEPHRHTDEALAELLRQLGDAVVIADAEGVITFWNDAATRLCESLIRAYDPCSSCATHFLRLSIQDEGAP